MNFTIIHPSRSRPHKAAMTASQWMGNAKDREDVQYIVSLDKDDNTCEAYDELFDQMNADVEESLYRGCYHNNRSCIDAINNAAKLSTGDIIIVVSDDFDRPPMHWDKLILDAVGSNRDFVLKTNDGLQPWIITLPIMGRKYYERFGYIYYPEYRHMFADTEMSHVGDLLGKKITADIYIPHRHYTTGYNERDAVSNRNDSTWHQGEALYLSRLERDFDLSQTDIKGVLRCGQDHARWLASKGFSIQNT